MRVCVCVCTLAGGVVVIALGAPTLEVVGSNPTSWG